MKLDHSQNERDDIAISSLSANVAIWKVINGPVLMQNLRNLYIIFSRVDSVSLLTTGKLCERLACYAGSERISVVGDVIHLSVFAGSPFVDATQFEIPDGCALPQGFSSN